jgi:hypothetical protein
MSLRKSVFFPETTCALFYFELFWVRKEGGNSNFSLTIKVTIIYFLLAINIIYKRTLFADE